MDIRTAAVMLQAGIALLLLLVLFMRLWPSVRLDVFRQEMFAVRDELFDYAAAGKIPFQHPAYRLLRQAMNGFIRYAHYLTFFRLCCTLLRWKVLREEPAMKWSTTWNQAVENIPNQDVKTGMQDFHARMLSLVAQRLIGGSPVLMVLLFIGVIAILVQTGWHSLRSALATAITTTIARIVDPRLLEEEAARLAA